VSYEIKYKTLDEGLVQLKKRLDENSAGLEAKVDAMLKSQSPTETPKKNSA